MSVKHFLPFYDYANSQQLDNLFTRPNREKDVLWIKMLYSDKKALVQDT